MLLIGVLAMSSGSIFVRWAQAEGAPSLVIAAYRLTAATLVMSIPLIRQRGWKDYATLGKRQWMILCLSGVFLALHFATWITSLGHTSVLSSVVLVSTTPLWMGLAGPLVLGERTSRITWIGMLVAILGGAVIGVSDISSQREGSLAAWGDVLALAGAIFVAGYYMIGRRLRERLRFVSYLWLVYGTAAVILTLWAAAAGHRLVGYSSDALLWMIALGLIPQLVGHSSANYALRFLPATMVGVSILGEPLGSTVLAAFLLREWPAPLQLAGAGLILLGITLALARGNRQPGKASPDPSA